MDVAALRAVLGRFASGVVVVTGGRPEGLAGFTCQSLFSLSLDPPLVALAPGRRSTSWPTIAESAGCTVTVLGDSQEALARAFARSGSDKFARRMGPRHHGGARLDGALAWLDCRIEHSHDWGDHHIAVARVAEMGTGVGEPLLFYRGGFGSFRA